MKRALLIVLDSVGIGGAADAAAFGDAGADTLGHIAAACAAGRGDRAGLRHGPLAPAQSRRLGLGLPPPASTGGRRPASARPRARAALGATASSVSSGKDTPSGHWEIAGVPVPSTGAISRTRCRPFPPR